jgi:release factor glutamine methyltransferase
VDKQATVQTLKQQVMRDQVVSLEDFFVLLAFITGQSKAFLFAHDEYLLTEAETTTLLSLLKRRALHEPVSYLTGAREFFGRSFVVNQHVLIPRPETELIIEKVLAQTYSAPTTFIDIGTGSGAIILTLSQELSSSAPLHHFLGVDISEEALTVASKNKTLLKDAVVEFIQSDLLYNISPQYLQGSLVIIANLPYVPEAQYHEAMPDVRLYEPRIALVSGIDGLDHYRRLIQELTKKQLPSFTLYLEIDGAQTPALTTLLEQVFPNGTCEVFKDLSGHDRLIRYTL